jgi:hypothetical protein
MRASARGLAAAPLFKEPVTDLIREGGAESAGGFACFPCIADSEKVVFDFFRVCLFFQQR